MNNQIKIRFAKPTDINQIIDLCELHAIYEKSEYKKADKAEQLANDLFSGTKRKILSKNNSIPLNEKLFEKDALVFKKHTI